jgi:hypothetical protein
MFATRTPEMYSHAWAAITICANLVLQKDHVENILSTKFDV